MKDKGFHGRGFVTFLTALSFLIIAVSGIVLYLAPQGRIAYWTDWRFAGLTKTDWNNIHIVLSIVFVLVAIYHIYYNWKVLTGYITTKMQAGIRLKKEIALSVILMLLIVIGSMYKIPPFGYIIDFSDYLKKSWIVSKDYEPPFGHAEELSLKVFTKKLNIDLEKAMAELRAKGIAVEDPNDSLIQIARKNKTNPMHIYIAIRKFEEKPAKPNITKYTAELVEEKFAGAGIGRKTLPQICEEVGIDISIAKGRLNNKGLKIKDQETFKEIADRYNTKPIEILKVILLEDYNIKI
ncbi:MAG: DUF4405 domain-containing protein [Thermodesulfovibrionales bacterium]